MGPTRRQAVTRRTARNTCTTLNGLRGGIAHAQTTGVFLTTTWAGEEKTLIFLWLDLADINISIPIEKFWVETTEKKFYTFC